MNFGSTLRRPPRWLWVLGGLAVIGVPLLMLALAAAALLGFWQWGNAAVGSGKAQLLESIPAISAPLDEALGTSRAVAGQARDALAGEPLALTGSLAPAAAEAIAHARIQASALMQDPPALLQPLEALTNDAKAAVADTLRAPLGEGGTALAATVAALAALQLPQADVAGRDPDHVPRLPGFLRVAYQQTGLGASVAYAGPAPLREVVDFYQRLLAEAGWQVQVLESTPAAERLRFERAGQALELRVSTDGPRRSRLQWLPAGP